MKFTYTVEKSVEKLASEVQSVFAEVKKCLPKALHQEFAKSVESKVAEMQRLTRKLEADEDTLLENDFRQCEESLERLERIETLSGKDLPKSLKSFETTEVLTADLGDLLTKIKSTVTKGRTVKISDLSNIKLKVLAQEASATASSASRDQSTLEKWREGMLRNGTVDLQVNRLPCTDILSATKKGLAIAMPPEQLFSANAEFENIPSSVIAVFQRDGGKIFQSKIDAGLKPIRTEIAQTLQRLSTDFEAANRRGDTKAAKTIFDNVNQFIGKDIPKQVEKVVEQAGAQTLGDFKKQEGKAHAALMDNTGAKFVKVSVDTSTFFQVDLVTEDSNPAEAAGGEFLKRLKLATKASSEYEKAAGEYRDGKRVLSRALAGTGDKLDEENLKRVKKQHRRLQDVVSELENSLKTVSDGLDKALRHYQQTTSADTFKKNVKVNRKMVSAVEDAAEALQAKFKSLAKDIDSIGKGVDSLKVKLEQISKPQPNKQPKDSEEIDVSLVAAELKFWSVEAPENVTFEEEFRKLEDAVEKLKS